MGLITSAQLDPISARVLRSWAYRSLGRSPSITAPSFNHGRWKIGRIDVACSWIFIRPGKPVDNAYIESFNGRLRDECMNVHQFTSLAEAKAIIEAWRVDYNQRRSHNSLGHLTPNEFVRQRQEDRALEGAPLQLQPVS